MATVAGPQAARTTGANASAGASGSVPGARPSLTAAATSSPSKRRKKNNEPPPAPAPAQHHTQQQFAAPDPPQQAQPPLYLPPQPNNSLVPLAPISSAGDNNSFPVEGYQGLQAVYRDGRVRNPIPSKLKGAMDGRGGSFGVMHIDLQTVESRARDEAAKRTSESTELAAKIASQSGYVSHSRRKLVPPAPDEGDYFVPRGPRISSLDAVQTKQEQARLLTLLRSLNPVAVVDQLCKGLAFFGGIPGAPAPADGSFPASAEKNGTGNLFVGWIAEIFPRLEGSPLVDGPVRAFGLPHEQEGNAPMRPHNDMRRPRGRPKGSKTKARMDKSGKKSSGAKGSEEAAPDAENSWVDMDESHVDLTGDGQGSGAAQAPTGAAVGAPGGDAPPAPKKRGRPKGSKNRPKEGIDGQAAGAGSATGAKPKGKRSKKQAQAAQPDGGASAQPGVDGNGSVDPSPAEPSGVEFALAALQTFNESAANPVATPTTSFRPANAADNVGSQPAPAATPTSGAKRKRKSNKASEAAQVTPQGSAHPGSGQPLPTSNGYSQPSATAGATGPPSKTGRPPAKRQRKAKDANTGPSATQTAPAPVQTPVPVPTPAPAPTAHQHTVLNDAVSENSDAQIDRETFEALQSQLEQEVETARRQEHTQAQYHLNQRASSHNMSLGAQQQQQQQQNQRQQQQASMSQSVSPLPPQQQMASSAVSHQQQQPPPQQTQSRSSYYTLSSSFPPQHQPQQAQHPPQTRHPQQQGIVTSSPGMLAQTAASDNAYRSASNNAAMNFNPSFGSQRSSQPSASPSVNAYSSGATQSPFNPVRQQSQGQGQQGQGQGRQGQSSQSMQAFPGFDTGTHSLFENISLDNATHGSLGLGAATSYSMGGSANRSTAAGTAGFGSAFDNMPSNERYYRR